MLNSGRPFLAIGLLTVLTSACVADVQESIRGVTSTDASIVDAIRADPNLYHQVRLRDVITPRDDPDADPEITETIRQTLARSGLLSQSGGKYVLDVYVLSISSPVFGFDISVSSSVRCDFTNVVGGQAFHFPEKNTYNSKVGDNLIAAERGRIATQGSIALGVSGCVKQLILRTRARRD